MECGTPRREPLACQSAPKGPKIEKIQDLEIFKRDWNFQARHPPDPYVFQETTKDPKVEGSRSYQGSVTALFRGTKAAQTVVLLRFGAIRERRMARDWSLLTSWTLDFRVFCLFLILWGILNVGIEHFKRDWTFQSRLRFFNLWALRGVLKTLACRGLGVGPSKHSILSTPCSVLLPW